MIDKIIMGIGGVVVLSILAVGFDITDESEFCANDEIARVANGTWQCFNISSQFCEDGGECTFTVLTVINESVTNINVTGTISAQAFNESGTLLEDKYLDKLTTDSQQVNGSVTFIEDPTISNAAGGSIDFVDTDATFSWTVGALGNNFRILKNPGISVVVINSTSVRLGPVQNVKISAALLPNVNNSHDIGSRNFQWQDLFATDIMTDSVTVKDQSVCLENGTNCPSLGAGFENGSDIFVRDIQINNTIGNYTLVRAGGALYFNYTIASDTKTNSSPMAYGVRAFGTNYYFRNYAHYPVGEPYFVWDYCTGNVRCTNSNQIGRWYFGGSLELRNPAAQFRLNGTIGTLQDGDLIDVENNNVKINGYVRSTSLASTYTGGSAFVCVYDNGTLFASDAVCP